MSAADLDSKKSDGEKKPSAQDIFDGFRKLREEQRQMASKLTELEMDKSEHKLVTETLEGLNPDRRCYRMIDSVLVERTVKEVLPALQKHSESIAKLIDAVHEQFVAKGREINEYKDKYNIRIQGEDLPGIAKAAAGGDSATTSS